MLIYLLGLPMTTINKMYKKDGSNYNKKTLFIKVIMRVFMMLMKKLL